MMKVALYRLVLFLVLLITGHDFLQLSSHFSTGLVKYACVGSTAVLPWTVSVNKGEEIHDIQWQFEGPMGTTNIGYWANGNFMPGLTYGQRVSFVPTSGIMLDHVTEQDTGNYTVEILGRNSTMMWSIQQRDFLLVLGDTVISSGGLQVTQQPQAVQDNVTGEWLVDLTCGDFTFSSQTPFDVQWTTPQGNVKPSSHYENGKFHLLIRDSETSGTYTCRVPAHNGCIQHNSSNDPGLAASVTIDEVKARLAILEAQVSKNYQAVKNDSGLWHQNTVLEQHNALLLQLNTKLMDERSELTEQNNQSVKDNANLTHRLQTLEQRFDELNRTIEGNPSGNQNFCGINMTIMQLQHQMKRDIDILNDMVANQTAKVTQNEQQCASVNIQTHTLGTQMNVSNHEVFALRRDLQFLQANTNNGTGLSSVVHFYVRLDHREHTVIHPGNVVKMSNLMDNGGNGYDTHSAVFTTPVSGAYFFVAGAKVHTLCHNFRCDSSLAGFNLVAEGVVKLTTRPQTTDADNVPYGKGLLVHGVVHLNKGDRVWLQNFNENTEYEPDTTSFTGFLIHQD